MKNLKLILTTTFLFTTLLSWGQNNVSLPASAGDDGVNNILIGNNAGAYNTIANNVMIGANAGLYNTNGFNNVFIGASTGVNNTGIKNVFIGAKAGNGAITDSCNVFIGYEAGRLLSGAISNKLYIENTPDTTSPLIYGDFYNDKLGIATSYVPEDYTMAVNGRIISEEVRVMESGTWPDYVFADEYYLMPLPELESEIGDLGHLPGVPSAEEVEKNGHTLGEMDAILLEKVEELTLHLIEMNKQMEALKNRNQKLEQRVQELEKQ